MARLVFITGGARSGKSAFALRGASRAGGPKLFVATLEPLDEEMKRRVELHRAGRGDGWDTREEPLHLAGLLRGLRKGYDVAVIDCLTLWLSNVMRAGRDADKEMEELVSSLADARECIDVYVVSNEVGMGIVPGNEMARAFRDFAGALNQNVAALADEAYLMASGIPVRIK